jgi:16S rRNA G966 N2-methylase RsmD
LPAIIADEIKRTNNLLKVHCPHDKLVSLTDLKPHPKNRNDHPKDQIKRLAQILDYQGFRYPIKVSKLSGFVTSGHGRIEAAKLNKWAQVPVSFQEYESEAQEYADLIADNSIASWSELDLATIQEDALKLKDFDLDLLGIKDFEIIEKTQGLIDEDEVPEPKEAIAKLGDLWILGNHRLLCGDSTDILQVEKLMNGEKADMVFTDPPYGMSAVSKSGVLSKSYHRGDIMNDDNVNVAKDAYNLCSGLSVPKLVFWGANYYCSSLPDASCWLVWDKNNGQSDQMDCELAWTNFKGVTRQFTKASEKSNRVHPTQKPVELIKWCFERWEAGAVIDLFGGSGSTLIACEKTNRKCFMMELDPHYVDIIVARWEKFTGQKAVLHG